MADVVTVTIPGLPVAAPVTGDEQIAVYQDGRLKKMPQALLRGSKTFTGPGDPPDDPALVSSMKLVIGDRWKNTGTGDEWKVTSLSPVIFTPDGNPSAAVVAPIIVDVTALKALTAPLPGQIANLQANERYKFVTRPTYAEVAALTLSADTTYAVPDSDTGTHAGISSEVGYVSGQVPNSGQFAYMGSPLALRRVAATGTAAIPGLTTSVDRLNRARSDYRPSDILESWTDSALNGDVAPSLTVGPAYSIVNGADGKALRVAANGSSVGIGPKRSSSFYAGETYEYSVLWSRSADGADPSLSLRLRGFAADGTSVGAMTLLTRSLASADGFKSDTIQITGDAIKAEMPTAVTAREYATRGPTGGPFDLSTITRRVVRDLAGSGNAPIVTTIPSAQLIPTYSADRKSSALMTFADFCAAVEAFNVPKYFRQDAKGTATSSPVRWIAEDPARNGGRLYHAGATGTVLVGWGGAPVAYSQNTERLGPGDYVDLSLSELGEIWLATDGPSIPIYGFYTNSSGINVNADAAAAKFLARMSGAQTDGQRTILSTLVKDLGAAGSLKKFRTLTIFANTDQVSSIVDMARDGINVTPNAAAFTTKVGFKGNGSSATIDLGYTPAQDSRLTFSSHGFGCFVQDATTDNLGAYALGMPFLGMQVNRSGNSVAVRSGSSSPVITTVDSKGGYFSVNRSSADGFRLRHNTFTYDVVATATTLGTKVYSALALASIAVNGPEGYSTLPLGAVWYCEPLTVSEDAATQAAMTKFFNAMKAS